MNDTATRYSVTAFHKQSPGDRSQYVVDYWRVEDATTGMRANGTAKYETPEQAQRWCDALNEVERMTVVDDCVACEATGQQTVSTGDGIVIEFCDICGGSGVDQS